MKHPYSIRLDDDINGRLEHIASMTGRTKTSFIREAIEQHIEDMEDYADAVAALKEGGKTITLEELESSLGLGNNVQT